MLNVHAFWESEEKVFDLWFEREIAMQRSWILVENDLFGQLFEASKPTHWLLSDVY